MQIEAGKYYRTRDGRKVGPAKPAKWPAPGLAWSLGSEWLYADDGVCGYGDKEEDDLIAEWTEGPVRTETVTKRRIVPGVYGLLGVGVVDLGGKTIRIGFKGHMQEYLSATPGELDSLAMVASQLAEALRDGLD